MVGRIAGGWLKWVTGYPKSVLCLIGLLVVAAAFGLPRFKLDASADALTLENDRDLSYFRELSKTYGSGEFLVVTFTPQSELFSNESLALLAQLQQELAVVDGVVDVNSILNVPLLFSPPQALRDIAKNPRTLLSPNMDLAQAKQEFLTSPIYKDMILSPDGQTTALQLNIAVDTAYIELVQRRDSLRQRRKAGENWSDADARELETVSKTFLRYRTDSATRSRQRIAQIREVTARYQNRAEIFVGGVSMITADMIRFIRSDLVIFGAAALLFMVAVLAVIFRSIRFVVIPMATCITAVFLMLGLVSWLDWRLTVISSNFVALLLIISLAIIIHLVVRYREYATEQPGWSQQELVSATIRYMAKPCLYTALTTIVAFGSLVISDIRPVIDFGWMMTIGLVVALVLAFALLPAALMLLPKQSLPVSKVTGQQKRRSGLTGLCARWVEQRGLFIWGGAVLIAGLSVYGISRLQVENRFIDYFHEDTEIHQGLYVIDNKLGGTTSLDIVVQAEAIEGLLIDPVALNLSDEDDPFGEADPFDEPDPFGRPNPVTETDPFAEADPFSEHGVDDKSAWMTVAGLEAIEDIHDYLESLPQIGKVQSLATLYKVGRRINGSLNNFELAVMEQSLSSEVEAVLLAPYLQGGKETRITMRVVDSYPGLQRAQLVKDIEQHLNKNLKVDTEHVRFSGLLVLYNNMLQSLFSSQIVTLGAVFVGIMLMFVILFHSIKIAIVAIIPNALAAGSILGAMGLAGIPLDMMTITVAAIAVGIGVDDTIHYLHRFKTELDKDGDYMQAMHRAHGSIGKAMYYTSIIIIFGFSIMVLSRFIPTIYFGVLTGMAMLAALSGALLLLPKLILLVRPFKPVLPS